MYELVYTSKASPDTTPEDIEDILNKARSFNEKYDITGCLLYYNNEFIQILEGDRKVVRGLYKRISKDHRHIDSMIITEGKKEERVFDDWSMAFHELNADDVNDMSKELFKSNFIAFSEMAQKPTFPVIMFWNTARELLRK